jgi:hypothetical protein
MMHDNYWLMPLVFAGLTTIRLVALGSKARVSGNRIEFSGTLLHRLLILLGSSGAAAVLMMTWRTSEVWVRLGLAIGALGSAAGWPPLVHIDDHEVTQKWWWRRKVAIPWSEVSLVEENGVGEYQIYGTDGRAVLFSRYLVDSQRFRQEVRIRAHRKVAKTSDPISITKA